MQHTTIIFTIHKGNTKTHVRDKNLGRIYTCIKQYIFLKILTNSASNGCYKKGVHKLDMDIGNVEYTVI